jgi:uncharacterized membrane protein
MQWDLYGPGLGQIVDRVALVAAVLGTAPVAVMITWCGWRLSEPGNARAVVWGLIYLLVVLALLALGGARVKRRRAGLTRLSPLAAALCYVPAALLGDMPL